MQVNSLAQALLIEGEQCSVIEWPGDKERWLSGEGTLWVDAQAPPPEELEQLAADFGLHSAVVRACLHPEHRARIKEFKDHFLLVLNAVGRSANEGKQAATPKRQGKHPMPNPPPDVDRWRALELNVIIGNRFMLTVHPEPVPAVSVLYQRLVKTGEGRSSLEYLLYSLCESVTSGYYVVLDRIDRHVDGAENQIFQGEVDRDVVDTLFGLKRHVLYLRRVLGPQRDVMGGLMRRQLPAISADAARPYFVDLYEHTLRLFDLIDTYRDLISSSLDAYLSVVSNRMNEIMQVLAIVSTIMLPLTLITGMFGMNVGGIPFAQSPMGFAIVTLMLVAIGAVLVLYFKRRRWL